MPTGCLFRDDHNQQCYIFTITTSFTIIKRLDLLEGPDGKTLNDLLQFWTCWPSLPMLEEKLYVSFLPKNESEKLAIVDTCSKSLKIPVIYSNYEEFKKSLDISVQFGKCGFGKVLKQTASSNTEFQHFC